MRTELTFTHGAFIWTTKGHTPDANFRLHRSVLCGMTHPIAVPKRVTAL
jgi:hypothetical protein